MKNPKFYLIYDLETLGLNPDYHQWVEFGGVLIDGETLEEVSVFQSYIQPRPPVLFEKQALDINGLSIEKLYVEGRPMFDVINAINKWLGTFAKSNFDIHMVCNNKTFDIPRLEKEYNRFGLPFPCHYSNKWDVKDQARDLGLPLEKISLQTLCEFFGIPYENAHGALNDSLMTAEVFRRLEVLRRYIEKQVQTPDSEYAQLLQKVRVIKRDV